MSEGAGVVIAGDSEKALIAFKVADTIRKDAAEAIAALKADGIRPVLITGDRLATARYVADAVGIDEIVADALPGDKQAAIIKL